jgi:hypothetical protein
VALLYPKKTKKMEYRIAILVFGFLGFTNAYAQLSPAGHFYGEDAYRFSRHRTFGTSRALGMGGAFVSLGGDASNVVNNPAGLGFYNKSEFSISPVFKNTNVNSKYLGTSSTLSSATTSIGQASVIFNSPGQGTRKKRSSFGLSYTKLADYANDYSYEGQNNKKSLTDYFAERNNDRNVDPKVLESEFDLNSGKPTSANSLYYNSYLIDFDKLGYYVKEEYLPVSQSGRITESGNLGQFNISYGVNYDDITYFGASLGIQSLNYSVLNTHNESYKVPEFFNSFSYYDNLIVRGGGLNLTLGTIIKATESLRLGLNVVTPTVLSVKETFVSGINTKPTATYTNNNTSLEMVPNDFDYRVTSPLKASAGISAFLPKKLGFVSFESEYVAFGKMKIKDKLSDVWSTEQNREIGKVYKDVVNFKLGSEFRISNYRIRGGANFQKSALKIPSLEEKWQKLYSVGAGYRNSKVFVDLSMTFSKATFAYTPYVLNDVSDYSSVLSNSKQNMLSISVGSFF